MSEGEKKSSYELAPDVEKVAGPLIEGNHTHLLKAKISYVFRDKAWPAGESRVVLGRAAKRTELDQLLSHKSEDFVMIIAKDRWSKMDDIDQRCLVDHELCHMGVMITPDGKKKFMVRKHVIEEFPENLARFERRRLILGELIQNPPSPISQGGSRRITLGQDEQLQTPYKGKID